MSAVSPAEEHREDTPHYQRLGRDHQATARRRLVGGTIWLVAGILITVVTAAHAVVGLSVVAWGPMLYGAVRIVLGLRAMGRSGW